MIEQTSEVRNEVAKLTHGYKVLGKEDFLKLLIEQLKHQDPLNPMDSLDFTAQLAQFTSLERLYNIESEVEKLVNSTRLKDNSYLISLIGKEVDATTGTVELAGGSATISFRADKDVTKAVIKIKDQNGNLVKEIDYSPVEEGFNTVKWDGTDNWGRKVEDGTYKVEVYGYKVDGSEVDLSGITSGVVKSVALDTGRVYLDNGQEVDASSIIKVREIDPKVSGDSSDEGSGGVDSQDHESPGSGSFSTLKNVFSGLLKVVPFFIK